GDAPLRTIPIDGNKPRQPISEYLDQWIAHRQAQASNERPYPVVIVTAEGGGILAAYWTATMLAALQDQHSNFADHVLALSRVSGGSVDASIFAALLNGPTDEAMPCRKAGGYEACARTVMRADLLSPPLASMLLAEPLHRLSGGQLGQSDRAL